MIKIFTGDDRVRAKRAIIDFLGENYEIVEGTELTSSDLPNIFKGNTLFTESRSILIRDLSQNKPVFEGITDYLDTPHKVAIFESKLDKRSKTYKSLKDQVVSFNLPEDPNFKLVFDIYRTAKSDGKKAVNMLEKIKIKEDPIMFFGLIVSQALKDFNMKQGTKEKTILKELSKVDLLIKSSPLDSWLLIESFLLRLSSL